MRLPATRLAVLSLATFVTAGFTAVASAQVAIPRSPNGVQAYFTARTGPNAVLVVWRQTEVETDSVWTGYRVRRTIKGITPTPFELIGEYRARDRVTQACLALARPCDLSQFHFYGRGLFFRGFRNNLASGKYIIDYPPGAAVDSCDSCWVFADQGNLGGFTSFYAITSIDTLHLTASDFTEGPIDPSQIVTVQPSDQPASNLEQVAVVPNPFRGSAEWDPAPGEHRVHFIHLPARSTVRIFTSNGDLVRVLTQNPNANPGGLTGDLDWDLKNADGRKVVSGIYIYQVESPQGHHIKGHFVVIR